MKLTEETHTQKKSVIINNLNNIINKPDIKRVYGVLYSATAEYSFLQANKEHYKTWPYTGPQTQVLIYFKGMTLKSMFSDHSANKLNMKKIQQKSRGHINKIEKTYKSNWAKEKKTQITNITNEMTTTPIEL